MSIDFLVSVRCFTYNQSAYIKDALNGFVVQQTNFPFVVLVVDDASTDGEQEVIRKFMAEEFELSDTSVAYETETEYAYIQYAQHKTNKSCFMVAMFLKENHYSQKKKKFPYLAEWRDGVKYEAICEGDDYWIDPLKLQKQVDFLESNPECGMCYTKAKIYKQNHNKYYRKIFGENIRGFEDLLRNGNRIPTLTSVVRTDLLLKYQQEINPNDKEWLMGDIPMWLYISYNSKIKFIESVTGVYRVLDSSASHNADISKQISFVNSACELRFFFMNKYNVSFDLDSFRDKGILREYVVNLSKNYSPQVAKEFREYYRTSRYKSTKISLYYYCSFFCLTWFVISFLKKIVE